MGFSMSNRFYNLFKLPSRTSLRSRRAGRRLRVAELEPRLVPAAQRLAFPPSLPDVASGTLLDTIKVSILNEQGKVETGASNNVTLGFGTNLGGDLLNGTVTVA